MVVNSEIDVKMLRRKSTKYENNFSVNQYQKDGFPPLGLLEISGKSDLPKLNKISGETINKNEVLQSRKNTKKLLEMGIVNSIIKAIKKIDVETLSLERRHRRRLINLNDGSL